MSANHHCSVVEISGAGVLIEGPSGSGKTALALGLLEAAQRTDLPHAFVCDDQALLHTEQGRLIAVAPQQTSGMMELRGFGIINCAHTSEACISLVVRLVRDEAIERMPSPEETELHGIVLPLCKVPQRHEAAAVRIVMAMIDRIGSDKLATVKGLQ